MSSSVEARIAPDAWGRIPRPDEVLERRELEQLLFNFISQLRSRERFALQLWTGFPRRDPETLDQIGERFGLSREGARQLVQRGLRVCRERWFRLRETDAGEQYDRQMKAWRAERRRERLELQAARVQRVTKAVQNLRAVVEAAEGTESDLFGNDVDTLARGEVPATQVVSLALKLQFHLDSRQITIDQFLERVRNENAQ